MSESKRILADTKFAALLSCISWKDFPCLAIQILINLDRWLHNISQSSVTSQNIGQSGSTVSGMLWTHPMQKKDLICMPRHIELSQWHLVGHFFLLAYGSYDGLKLALVWGGVSPAKTVIMCSGFGAIRFNVAGMRSIWTYLLKLYF